MQQIPKPIIRSQLRARAGMLYYGSMRRLMWLKMRKLFAKQRTGSELPYLHFEHRTPLLRKLKDVDMQLQYNKIINLKIASQCIDGITVRPGEIFSYWRLIGNPTSSRGFVDGMILKNGKFSAGVGGGLCQLSNLIFWMTLHTPLTVIERHRHGYDVFPDSNRTQPFGSGATCYYPHGDLMIRNDTPYTFQLKISVGEKYLEGQWRCDAAPIYIYNIIERDHEMKSEYWGGYSRHNKLYRQTFNPDGDLLSEDLVVENSAIMMYSPFLEEKLSK